jgi:penicillin-binding protein 1A
MGGALLLGWLAARPGTGMTCPPLDKATDYRPRQHLLVLTSDGAEIAQFGSERRVFVPIAKMPLKLQQAVLAVEDTDFYNHGGISFRGLVRATLPTSVAGCRRARPPSRSRWHAPSS